MNSPSAASGGGRPRVLSGIQPTADSFHVGNYLGAVRQWVELQAVARDLLLDRRSARDHRRTRPGAAAGSAPGWPPPSCSRWASTPRVRRCSSSPHVPAHTQLSWVMECITGFGEAGRMTQFKDKSARRAAPTGPAWACSPTRSCRRRTSSRTRRTRCRSARTSASISSSPATWRSASTPGTAPTLTVPEPYILKETAKIYDLSEPRAKMSKIVAGRLARSARAGQGVGQEDQVRGHRHRAGDPVRRGSQARRLQPAVAAVGVHRDADPAAREGTTRARDTGELKGDLADAFDRVRRPRCRSGSRFT